MKRNVKDSQHNVCWVREGMYANEKNIIYTADFGIGLDKPNIDGPDAGLRRQRRPFLAPYPDGDRAFSQWRRELERR